MKDNQRDRERRTVTAPNGARVILPPGTSDFEVMNRLLRYVYEEPMRRLIERDSEIAHVFKVFS